MKLITGVVFAVLTFARIAGAQTKKPVPTTFGKIAIGETFEEWADANNLGFAPAMCQAAVKAAASDDKKGWTFLTEQFKALGRVSTSTSGLFTTGTVVGDYLRCEDFVSGSDFVIPIHDFDSGWNGKIKFQSGKVDEIDLTFDSALSDVLPLMEHKYGKPTAINHDVYENGFGATFEKPSAIWEMRDGTSILASGTSPFDTSQHTFVIFLSKAADKRMKEAKKAQPNPF
jgi:hypothetical protein